MRDADASHRGWYIVVQSMYWTVGCIAMVGFTWLSSDWRHLMFLASLPSMIGLALNYMYLPESPRFCVAAGREAEAKVSVICWFE